MYRKNCNQLTEDIEVPEEMTFMEEEELRQMEAQSTFKNGRVRVTQGSGYRRVCLEFIACLGNSYDETGSRLGQPRGGDLKLPVL